MSVERAVEEIQKGNFVLVHDASEREDETDMVIAAEKTTPADVAKMRSDGGGLICTSIHPESAKNLDLPLMAEIYQKASSHFKILQSAEADDIPYGERSSFSITVNHRDTFTGITDDDRSLTIKKLAEISAKAIDSSPIEEFGKKFRSPGHVPLLRAADNLFEEREGHTEYSIALMEMAGVKPAGVVCEMMDEETHGATSGQKTERYAEENEMVRLEGDEIKEEYLEWKKRSGGQ